MAAEIVLGIVLKDGRLLVQRRRGDPDLEGRWEFPGGKRASGEPLEQAVVREVAEETGLVVAPGELLVSLGHSYPDRRVTLYAYICTPTGATEPRTGAEWVTPAEYGERPMPAANPPILDALSWHLARLDGQ